MQFVFLYREKSIFNISKNRSVMKTSFKQISCIAIFIWMASMNLANAQHLKITSFIFPDTARVSQSYNNIQVVVTNTDSNAVFTGAISIRMQVQATLDSFFLYTDSTNWTIPANNSITYSINGYHFVTPHPYMAGHDVIIVWPVAAPNVPMETLTDSVYIIDDTGIPEIDRAKGLYIYPNPANKELNYLINHPQNEIYYVRIISVLGQEMERINPNTRSLSVNDLPSGMYFIEIKLKDGSSIKEKFIKE